MSEEHKKPLKCEIYRDSMQNYKKYAIPKAQLIIADVPYAWIDKQVLSSADGNTSWAREKIYINKRTYDKLDDFDKFRIKCNFAEQMTLF